MDKKRKQLESKILKKMGLTPNKKNRENLSGKKLNKFNYLMLLETGKPEFDYLALMDTPNDNLFEMNLKEWDIDNAKFQRKHGMPVRRDALYSQGEWFRAIEKDEFSGKHKKEILYGTLESARSYVYVEIIEKLNDMIDQKFPRMFKRHYGEKLFTPIPGNPKLSKMKELEERVGPNKDKRDKMVKVMRDLSRLEIEDWVINKLKPYDSYTFKNDSIDTGSDASHFIIGGWEAAENIHFRSFFKDFYDLEQPMGLLDNLVSKGVKKYYKELKKRIKRGH